jgi:hypothetical protein
LDLPSDVIRIESINDLFGRVGEQTAISSERSR